MKTLVLASVFSGALLGPVGCASRNQRNPEHSFALYQVAMSSFQADRLEAARGEAEKALVADPENAEAHHLLGLIALRRGAQYVAQVQTLDCIRGEEETLVRADADRAFREATEYFRAALRLRNDFAQAWNNLAVAALNLQEWDVAIDAATRALSVGTYAEPFAAQGNRGWAYYHKKDYQSAWRDLHDAVARQPGFCVGRYRLAKVYTERSQFAEAMEQIDAVVADPRCPIQEAFLQGGLLSEKLGASDRAEEFWARCIELAPRSCVAAECRRYGGMMN